MLDIVMFIGGIYLLLHGHGTLGVILIILSIL